MPVDSPDKIKTDLYRFVDKLRRRHEILERRSQLFSKIRLIVATTLAILSWWVYNSWGPSAATSVAFASVVCFSSLVYFHNKLIYSIRKHKLYEDIKLSHVARIERDWKLLPQTTWTEADAYHPFARDLNLQGPRSLHHLIDTSFSEEGSARLQSWLMPVQPNFEASNRQQALVKELVPLNRFRDRISLLAGIVTRTGDGRWQGDVLLKWLDTHVDTGKIVRVLLLLGALAVATPVLIALQVWSGFPNLWVYSLMIYVSLYLLNFRLYTHLFDEAEHLYFQLNRFRPIFEFLESNRFSSGSQLEELAQPLQQSEHPPSSYLRTVSWLSVAASAQKNEVLRVVLNLLMPWDLFFTFVLSRYKKQLREHLPEWLEAIQTLEAASSLATFGALNPKCTFAKFVSVKETAEDRAEGSTSLAEGSTSLAEGSTSLAEGSVFLAEQIGHPLLEESVKIRNSFRVDSNGSIALITGSNMSGKSTFLRTLGSNMCLAYAGGPIDAARFQTIPFRLFTCINVADSVNDGISYFYAEVKRLKRLLTELQQAERGVGDTLPLFFMIDEVFRGTNNRERYIGSRALLLALCDGYGTGLVSTHDLELVKLEDDVPAIRNFHFREHIEKGRMIFDYTLRPGPCPTTNALKIMALEGLPIGDIN